MKTIFFISACPSDWVVGLDGSCYYMTVETGSWDEAHASCSSFGAHLVKIENSQENDFIGSVISSLSAHFYIGLTDKDTEGRPGNSYGSIKSSRLDHSAVVLSRYISLSTCT